MKKVIHGLFFGVFFCGVLFKLKSIFTVLAFLLQISKNDIFVETLACCFNMHKPISVTPGYVFYFHLLFYSFYPLTVFYIIIFFFRRIGLVSRCFVSKVVLLFDTTGNDVEYRLLFNWRYIRLNVKDQPNSAALQTMLLQALIRWEFSLCTHRPFESTVKSYQREKISHRTKVTKPVLFWFISA